MKVYSIQETYYQTGNTGMAIHLEGTTQEIMELHKIIMEAIAKAQFLSMMKGNDSEPDYIANAEVKAWVRYKKDQANGPEDG